MPVEIGSLVVRGNFSDDSGGDETVEKLRQDVSDMQQRMIADVADMIADAERRRQER